MILVSLDDGSSIVLSKAVMFFGRGHECDIVLSKSRKVSRKHCCIAQIDDGYLVRDLGSMNGVRVNESKADPELPLNVGDELWVGDVGFQFRPASANGMSIQPSQELAPEEENPKEKQVNPLFLSMDHPVAIPDESQDLIIEESIRQKIIDVSEEEEIIEVGEEDIIED